MVAVVQGGRSSILKGKQDVLEKKVWCSVHMQDCALDSVLLAACMQTLV